MIRLLMRQSVAPWVVLQVRQSATRSAGVTAPFLVVPWVVPRAQPWRQIAAIITIRHRELITAMHRVTEAIRTSMPREAIITGMHRAGVGIRMDIIARRGSGKKDAADRTGFFRACRRFGILDSGM